MTMTADQADALAKRITRSWRTSLTTDAYAEQLLEYSYGPAEAAVRKLIREEEHAPSIARLRSAVRAQTDPGLDRHERPGCTTCGGDGLRTTHTAWCGKEPPAGERLCLCNQFIACGCPAGRDMAPILRKAREHNNATVRGTQ